MGYFAGMDKDYYPGPKVMEALAENTNLWWTGLYLTPSPSHGMNLGWMHAYHALKAQGWGLAPLYVGQQELFVPKTSHTLTQDQGVTDAKHAASLATTAGIPAKSVIYLDIESQAGMPASEGMKAYYGAWVDELLEQGYEPGVYCSPYIAPALDKVDDRAYVWAARYLPGRAYASPFPEFDPTTSGTILASSWQFAGNCTIRYKNKAGIAHTLVCDLDSSQYADPSHPHG